MTPFKKMSLAFVGFLQALGITLYCSLIGLLLWRGDQLFGPVRSFLAPFLVLSLLVASVLICGLLAFGYPVILFWDKKDTRGAVRLVSYTAIWLALVVSLLLVLLIIV